MVKGGEELTRGRIPKLGAVIRASRQDPSAVGTERRVAELILMLKGGHKLARDRIPELGGVVPARCERGRAMWGACWQILRAVVSIGHEKGAIRSIREV